jgi:glycosyltransferase involved in cell wall biosynthesis
MKILLIQDYLRSGGTERQSVLLTGAFAAAGHSTNLLTFRPGGTLAKTLNPAVSRRTLQPFDTGLDWFAPGLTRAVAAIGPEVVLCMGRMANGYAGRLQEKFPALTVVATMRTGKPLPASYRRSLHRVQHIVANSRESKLNLVAQLGLADAKISVIYNSLLFPADPAPETRAAWRTRHLAGPDTVVLVCVAMFRPEKNQRELIEVAATLPDKPDWQLWLAGDGPARAACERLAAERGLGARVKFLGFLSDPSAVLSAADVAVHASGSESLSNFVIEAQAHGLPAVVCEAQGIRECLLPDQTGWVVPAGDRAGFAARLQPLLADASFRRARGARARAFARAQFDPGRQAGTYLDLFARLAELRPRP